MGSGRLCAKTSCLTHFCPEILPKIVLPHGCIKKPDLICRIEKASIVVFRFLPKDTASWISFCQVVLEASHGTTAGDFRATPSIQIDPCLRCHWLVRNDFSSFSRLRRGTSARLACCCFELKVTGFHRALVFTTFLSISFLFYYCSCNKFSKVKVESLFRIAREEITNPVACKKCLYLGISVQ